MGSADTATAFGSSGAPRPAAGQEQMLPGKHPVPESSVPTPTRGTFGMRDLVFGLAGLMIGAGILGGIWGITAAAGGDSENTSASNAETTLSDAKSECDIDDDSTGITADSRSVTFSGAGKYGAALDDLTCLLEEVHAPASTTSKIDQTRALDGRQEDAWGDFEASWTYHPDSGLNLVIEVQDVPAG